MRKLLGIAMALACAGGVVRAAEVEVRMLNKGEAGAMVFESSVIVAAPGDTIRFVPTDKSHKAIKGMLPDGVEPFKSKPSE